MDSFFRESNRAMEKIRDNLSCLHVKILTHGEESCGTEAESEKYKPGEKSAHQIKKRRRTWKKFYLLLNL